MSTWRSEAEFPNRTHPRPSRSGGALTELGSLRTTGTSALRTALKPKSVRPLRPRCGHSKVRFAVRSRLRWPNTTSCGAAYEIVEGLAAEPEKLLGLPIRLVTVPGDQRVMPVEKRKAGGVDHLPAAQPSGWPRDLAQISAT